MACAHGVASMDGQACAHTRVMLSTAVLGSVAGPAGQQVVMAEPCYTSARTLPRDAHTAGTDGVAAGPCMPGGKPAKTTLTISGCLASSRGVQQRPHGLQQSDARPQPPQPFATSPAGQVGLAARRCLRPPPGLTALEDKEGGGSKTDSDGGSTADTSRAPSPTGDFGTAGSRPAASCLDLPTGRLAPKPAGVPVLRLESALPQELLGSPELPSEGSRWHRLGICKPCAFVFKGGCSNGVACNFCHLCPPGEKKMRKQARKPVQRGPGMWQVR
mmetsp:Transcript_59139/g.183343  ORF Transcript_59139/g.183343 Transcript_59139/m.183343 type:complete len:273 (-) Transcript_59139:435-1253(-)